MTLIDLLDHKISKHKKEIESTYNTVAEIEAELKASPGPEKLTSIIKAKDKIMFHKGAIAAYSEIKVILEDQLNANSKTSG